MAELKHLLRKEKAEPLEIPLIKTNPPGDWSEVDRAISNLSLFSVMVFTSRNTVRFFVERVKQQNAVSSFSRALIAAIGLKTAEELERYGLKVDIVPKNAHAAEELRDEILKKVSVKGKKILFPRAKEGRSVLIEGLEQEGAKVSQISVYETVSDPLGQSQIQKLMRDQESVDWFTFASGSAVRSLMEVASKEKMASWFQEASIRIAAIGKVTQGTLQEWGLEATVVAETPSGEDLVRSMVDYERKKQNGSSILQG